MLVNEGCWFEAQALNEARVSQLDYDGGGRGKRRARAEGAAAKKAVVMQRRRQPDIIKVG